MCCIEYFITGCTRSGVPAYTFNAIFEWPSAEIPKLPRKEDDPQQCDALKYDDVEKDQVFTKRWDREMKPQSRKKQN